MSDNTVCVTHIELKQVKYTSLSLCWVVSSPFQFDVETRPKKVTLILTIPVVPVGPVVPAYQFMSMADQAQI